MVTFGLSACGTRISAATNAIAGADRAYSSIHAEAMMVAPEQAAEIQSGLADARALLEKGNARVALAKAEELEDKVESLGASLTARRTNLEARWQEASAVLPGALAALDASLDQRLARGIPRKQFEVASVEFIESMILWKEAQNAARDGRLAQAVAKAEEARQRVANAIPADGGS
jgi:hypothetical protein